MKEVFAIFGFIMALALFVAWVVIKNPQEKEER